MKVFQVFTLPKRSNYSRKCQDLEETPAWRRERMDGTLRVWQVSVKRLIQDLIEIMNH